MGSKKLLPRNFLVELNFLEEPVDFHLTAAFCLQNQTKFQKVKGIINAFDHLQFCMVLNLTATELNGKRTVFWRPPFASRARLFKTNDVVS